ncbi:hypothetical protein V493_04811 [Pseudogymnoascus sp. VKM F-4281 (FW-2241)]|nr:hypothetical protein V493_04811 [Pseudogymnoascus sp. VKM F-4281 (FW-2241)]
MHIPFLTLTFAAGVALNPFLASCTEDFKHHPLPLNFGVLLFPAFQALDVFGPLDALNLFSQQRKLNLALIAPTLDPVSTASRHPAMNPFNSSFSESILPTHTFDTAPPLDVLLIPGGIGTRSPDPFFDDHLAFIRSRFPKLRYLITVCTGAHLAARAGVLDGRKATTNKRAWADAPKYGPKVKWIAHARWVADGKVWTSAGVSAGIDAMLAWVGEVYGADHADELALFMEYERHGDPSWDPFAEYYNITDHLP